MNSSSTPYACAICKKEFHNSISLVKHVEWRHRKSRQLSKFSNKIIEIDLSNDYQSDSETLRTNKKANDPVAIKEKEIEPNSNDVDNQSQVLALKTNNDENSGKYHNQSDIAIFKDINETEKTEKIFSCLICSESFWHRNSLNLHEKVHLSKSLVSETNHEDNGMFVPKEIEDHATLSTSKNSVSGNQNDSRNDPDIVEDQKLENSSNQDKHETIETSHKVFSCSHCEEKFKTNLDKQIHEKTHTGENTYRGVVRTGSTGSRNPWI